MARRKRKNQKAREHFYRKPIMIFALILLFVFTGVGVTYFGTAYLYSTVNPVIDDPNFYIKTLTTHFFEDNDAEMMIPIILCESHFRHYDKDGNVLVNMEGSSAVGIAQILTSVHPDPKILKRYNSMSGTNLSPEDLDVTTFSDNLRYALILFKVNGTKDWACSKKVGLSR